MGWIDSLISMSPAGELNDKYVNKGIFGIDRNKNQVNQQAALTDVQTQANLYQMGVAHQYQKDMYDYTYNKNTPQAQMKNLKEAGLNPALLYGLGGQGGASTGNISNTSAGSGTAETPSQREAAQAASVQNALNARMQESQIAVNEATAKKLGSEAENLGEQTITEREKRDIMVENMRQQGISQWLDNLKEDWKRSGRLTDEDSVEMQRNEILRAYTNEVNKNSPIVQEIGTAILKTNAETGKIDAEKILASEKAKGYWKELVNDTMRAEAAKAQGNAASENAISKRIEANAQKLATEWGTGEYTNWKTWKDTAQDGIKMILDIAKLAM